MAAVIPFKRPALRGQELLYVADAFSRGRTSGDGHYSKLCAELFQTLLGASRAFLTPSCTHALELAALLLNIKPDDEVLVPAFTFVSTANAFVLRGARPVFVDSRPDTLNLDEQTLEALITPRTRAIVAMHYAGVACAMETITEIAARHSIPVVEDNAHGLFGSYHGKPLGTLAPLAVQSFHDTKNFSSGEGGALLINDARHVERAEILRQKGTDRSRFMRGEVDEYTWQDLGSSYAMSDVLAAVLFAQLERRAEIQARHREIWNRYATELEPWARENGLRLPVVPAGCDHTAHLFYLLLPSGASRPALIEQMRSRCIEVTSHYVPLNISAMGRRLGGRVGQCPVAEDNAARLVRLPIYSSLGGEEQTRVIESLSQFRS